MPPVPNETDPLPVQLVSKEPVDIENLLKLNPRVKTHANAVPSVVTKKVCSATWKYKNKNYENEKMPKKPNVHRIHLTCNRKCIL